jgi:hypothetical protein
MSDFQNDRDRVYDPNVGTSSTGGLLAAGALVVVVIALLVVFGHPANQGTNNGMANNAPPPMIHTPLSSPAAPTATPAPGVPARP